MKHTKAVGSRGREDGGGQSGGQESQNDKGSRSPQGQTARAREAMGAFGTSPTGDHKKP